MKRTLIGILAGLFLAAAAIAADNFNVLDKLNISFSTATITGQLAAANGGSGVANSKNLTWSNSLTFAGTDATTMTFPSTSATIARTDTGQTFTGTQQVTGIVAATVASGAAFYAKRSSSGDFLRVTPNAANSGATVDVVDSTEADYRPLGIFANGITIASRSGAGTTANAATFTNTLNTSLVPLLVSTGTTANQLRTAQTTVPTCTANCGTSPSVVGTDTAGRVTMGASGVPASAWVLTFNGTWASAPVCSVTPALASMVVGKLPIAVVTNTTTMTVTTNGTAPANSDQYQYICVGVS